MTEQDALDLELGRAVRELVSARPRPLIFYHYDIPSGFEIAQGYGPNDSVVKANTLDDAVRAALRALR